MEKELTAGASAIRIAGYLRENLELPETDIRTYSPLTLAFIGDSIFDLVIRTCIVESGNAPVNKLHKCASRLVQATAQAELYHLIQEQLTEEESAVYKRGRNAKSFTSSKNASVVDYRIATGLEALMGYLYLTDRMDRLLELVKPQINKMVSIL
jgi:ribonuclease-3 family protein